MSLLSVCRDAAVAVGLPRPEAISGAIDPNSSRLLSLCQQEGDELARRHDWQALIVAHSWTSVAAEEQPDALPGDYDRLIYLPTVWNRSLDYRVRGPVSTQEWQWLLVHQSGGYAGYWRLVGGKMQIRPAPAAGQTYSLEYLSRNWIMSGGAPAATWATDADTARIPERLLTLGLIWRWKRSIGLDYSEEMATYEREVERACSRDRGLKPIVHDKYRAVPTSLTAEPGGTILVDSGDDLNVE